MNRTEVFSRVKKALVEKLDVDEDQISLDADLRDDLGGSSLELVDLVMDLGREAKIKIELEELRSIQKVKDVVELIQKKLS